MRDIINSILDNYSNMYLYKNNVTENDLLELFSHKPHDLVEMLWSFMKAGLSPEKITPKVQAIILVSSSNYAKQNQKEAPEKWFFGLFRQYNIQMPESTLKRFVVSKGCHDLGMMYPRDILHYGIMHCEDTPSKIDPVFIMHDIVKYMLKKGIKFSEEEKLKVLQDYFCLLAHYPYTALKEEFIDNARMFFVQNTPFAYETVKQGIATNDNVLRFFVKEFPYDRVCTILNTPELQKLAIQTFPDTKLVSHLASTTENQTTYIALKPSQAYDDFKAATLVPASDVVKKQLEIIGAYMNNKNINPSMLSGLAYMPSLLRALIKTKFDRLTWYKIMETILSSNKKLSDDVLQEMMSEHPEVDVLIYKYYPEFFTKKQQKKEPIKQTKKIGFAEFFENLFTVKQAKNMSRQRGEN